LTWARVWAWY